MPSWELPKDVEILFKVLEIREENGYDFPRDLNHLKISIYKSALFHRMMEGKDPLPVPPPRSYSYPWYSLIEDGYGFPYEVWKEEQMFGFPAIGIDQSIWKLEEELGDKDYIVRYFYGKANKETKESDTRWHVYCIGCRVPQSTQLSSSNFLWKIERID